MWYLNENYLSYTEEISNKMAIFNLDETIIYSSKGCKRSDKMNDFVFAYPDIIQKLQGLKENGFVILFVSICNMNTVNLDIFMEKMNYIYTILNVSFNVVLLDKSKSLLYSFISYFNTIPPLIYDSFYCGFSNYGFDLFKCMNVLHPRQIFELWPNMFVNYKTFKLIITVGQVKSGWSEYNINDEMVITINKDKIDNIDKSKIYLIKGCNPTFQERENLRQTFQVDRSECLILLFCQPPLKWYREMIYYSNNFESPYSCNEFTIRMN